MLYVFIESGSIYLSSILLMPTCDAYEIILFMLISRIKQQKYKNDFFPGYLGDKIPISLLIWTMSKLISFIW